MGGGGSRRNADNALGPANGGGVKTRNSSPYPPGEGTGGCNTGQFASRCCTGVVRGLASQRFQSEGGWGGSGKLRGGGGIARLCGEKGTKTPWRPREAESNPSERPFSPMATTWTAGLPSPQELGQARVAPHSPDGCAKGRAGRPQSQQSGASRESPPHQPGSRAHLGWPEALPPGRTLPLLREPQPSPQKSPSPEQSRPPVPKREPPHGRSAAATRQVTSYSTLAPYSAPEPKPLVAGHRPIRLLDRRWCRSVT